MTLVDTSVWINHLDRGDTTVVKLLDTDAAALHPFVLGELAAGTIKHRDLILAKLAALPRTPIAKESEVHHLLQSHRLWGTGLGWVDLHLLTAALLAGWTLLTADRAMSAAARKLGIAHPDK